MATAQQIANNIATLSPEHRIIRYVAKMWRNRNNTTWNADKFVQKIKTNGELDRAKIRQHFIDRAIITGEEFDTAVQRGIDAGVLTADLRTTGQLLLDVFDIIEARVLAENEEAQAQRDALRLSGFTEPDRSNMAQNYNARTQEILATLP